MSPPDVSPPAGSPRNGSPAASALAAPALRFTDVHFAWPGAAEPLLAGFSLELEAGQVTALVGPSGCGKSTLLRLAVGLLDPGAGEVVGGEGESRAFVFQSPNLLPWRTVRQNVALPLELQGRQDEAAVDQALDAVGLRAAAGLLPGALSGGMRMRCSLARALVLDPTLLVLDEPFSALDAITRREAWVTFQEAWGAQAATVVVVTHDIDEAVILADRVVVLGGSPVRVQADLSVGLPRPRSPELRHDPRVGERVRAVEGAL